jgi:hypothetical protein
MQPGDVWTYQEMDGARVTPVRIVKLGVKAPPRVQVKFLEDEYEGAVDWVPLGRLKVPWDDRGPYLAEEDRWSRINGRTRPPALERDAAWEVFRLTVDSDIADLFYNGAAGVLEIRQMNDLVDVSGMPRSVIMSAEATFSADGITYAPWPMTKLIARTLASAHPGPILQTLAAEEVEARKRAFDSAYSTTGYASREEIEVRALEALGKYMEHLRPRHELLRWWCGVEAVNMQADLERLRTSWTQLAALCVVAVDELASKGTKRASKLADDIRLAVSAPHEPRT